MGWGGGGVNKRTTLRRAQPNKLAHGFETRLQKEKWCKNIRYHQTRDISKKTEHIS